MTDVPSPTGYIEDVIKIEDQLLPIVGSATGEAVSEFETGLKVGNQSYDTRTNAFYLVMDDFSGGMGHRRLNIRDPKKVNTFWDYVEGVPAADTRRPHHLTLGPKQVELSAPPPSKFGWVHYPQGSVMYAPNGDSVTSWMFMLGDLILESFDGNVFTPLANTAGVGTALVFFHSGDALYAFSTLEPPPSSLTKQIRAGWTTIDPGEPLTDGLDWGNVLLATMFGAWDKIGVGFAVQTGADFGDETWNFNDPNDGKEIGGVHGWQFTGILPAPWGEPAAHFIANGPSGHTLYALDFYSRTAYPIRIGTGLLVTDSKVWSGQAAITDGRNLLLYNPGKAEIVNVGFPRVDGTPPTLADHSIRLTYLIPEDSYLYAIGQGPFNRPNASGYRMNLYCYNGQGWHQIGGSHAILAQHGAITQYVASDFYTRLQVLGIPTPTTTSNGVPNPLPASGMVVSYYLPNASHVPIYGLDHFDETGALITGWLDGGFADIDGALLRMTIDALHLTDTETVKVEYQLNNDESGAWVQLFDSAGTAAVFDSNHSELFFQHATPAKGRQFRTVRFRITLSRGPDDTLTPEVKALILVFIKKPHFRSSWAFNVDVSRMLEAPDAWLVNGAPATMANIWAKLQSLWNTQTLLSLSIPSVEANDLNVMLTQMPITFDDFRTAVAGKGTMMIKCLEPISR